MDYFADSFAGFAVSCKTTQKKNVSKDRFPFHMYFLCHLIQHDCSALKAESPITTLLL